MQDTKQNVYMVRMYGYAVCKASVFTDIDLYQSLYITWLNSNSRMIPNRPYIEKPGDQQLPFKKFDTPRKITDDLKYYGPWGIAVNKRGEIIVSLYGEYCVSIFSPSGERIRTFGMQGSAEGQFTYPRGVAVNVDDDICILAVDEGNHRIQKFTSDGQFIAAVGSIGNKPLQFNSITQYIG